MRKQWIWLLLVVLFLAARYQNLPGVLTDRGVELNDTDPYYRLHRIERIVKTDWVYPLKDPALSYPKGFQVPWPTGLDYLVAVPLKLLHVHSRLTIEVFSALIIPILALPALFFICGVAYILGGSWFAYAAGFLAVFAPTDIYASALGRLDHHFLEGLITIAALYFSLKKRWLLLALLLGLGPSFWPQAWVVGLFLSFSFLIDPNSEPRTKAPSLFFSASLLSQIPLVFSDVYPAGMISIFGFSWWSTIFYAVLSLFFLIQQKRFSWWILPYTFVIALFLGMKNGLGVATQTASVAYRALSASQGILQSTSETISTFLLPVKSWPTLGLIPLVLAWIWFVLQSFQKARWGLIGYFAGPLILCALQARFIPLCSPIMILGSLFLLKDFSDRVVKYPEYQKIVFALAAVALAIPSLPRFQWMESGNAHPLYIAVRNAAQFLEKRNVELGLSAPDRSIAAHWDDGHWLLYYGKMPVVAHPFQDSSSVDTLTLFVSEKNENLTRFVETYPIRYLLVETPTMRLSTWLRIVGKRPANYFKTEKLKDGTETDTPLPRFYQLLSYRFFMQNGTQENGNSLGDWRLVYVSPYTFYGRKGAPCIKVFERVRGATFVAKSKQKDLTLVAQIHSTEGEFYFHEQATVLPDGSLQWRVPYAKTNAGGIEFSGQFFVDTPQGRRKKINITVSEDDIAYGRLIDVGNIRW